MTEEMPELDKIQEIRSKIENVNPCSISIYKVRKAREKLRGAIEHMEEAMKILEGKE